MSEFKFSCPHCQQHILCDALWSGRAINCPACQQMLMVPSLGPPAPPIVEQVSPPWVTAVAAPPRPPGQKISPAFPARVPLLARIYAILIMIIGALGAIVAAILLVVWAQGGILGLVIGGVLLLYMVVVIRVGSGLRSGQRQAVYGLCVLTFIDLAFRGFSFAATGAAQHLWFLVFALGLFYLPPLVSAFRNWAAFA